jgi:hypothetical protein
MQIIEPPVRIKENAKHEIELDLIGAVASQKRHSRIALCTHLYSMISAPTGQGWLKH